MHKSRQPDRTGKIKQDEFNFYVAGMMAKPMTCTECGSNDTEPLTELTHQCNECDATFSVDNLPPTDDDLDRDDILNMYLNEEI